MEHVVALLALSAMEIVLGIDNLVFITILTSRLPPAQQAAGRKVGLALALLTRLLLLMTLSWILNLKEPFLHLEFLTGLLTSIGVAEETRHHVTEVSVRDLILFSGGLFLLWKSVHEIHKKMEGDAHDSHSGGHAKFWPVVIQIGIFDIIFSK